MNAPPRKSMSASLAGLALAALFLSIGCSTMTPVQSMKDPQADFNSFNTFAWDKGQEGAPAQPVTILDQNIRAAIGTELQSKGYVEAAAGTSPDLMLQYETGAAEMIKSNPFRIGVGMGGYGSSGGASVGMSTPSARNVTEGKLILRAIDPKRNAEVWNGSVSRELGKEGPDAALIQSAVRELLEKFPAKSGDLQ